MEYSGIEKAAIFLISIGEEAAAEIMKNLEIHQVGMITTCMGRLKSIKKQDVDDLMKEVSGKISSGDLQIPGGDYVKKILKKGLGDDNASKILELAAKESSLDSLKWVDPKTLSNFLVNEHPQTVALILSLLETAQAAEVLAKLPEHMKEDVVKRIATTENIPETAISELEEVLKGQLEMKKGKGRKVGGIKAVAEILNHSDRSTEQMILEKMEKENQKLADSIRQLMFVFDDLVQVEDKGIQMILKEVRTEDLSLALKSASNSLKEKIFKNMSQRAAQILKDEMETKGPAKVSEVEKAQQNIVKIARKLEAEGKIAIAGRGGDELIV
ncbi:MAG TPA: flagellar motor switch protein FliG [Thermodesulfobacteriota bacterium]|nr:flagellar motor switch protein FliG [Thermodesulfobacteriota bacterium]